LTDLCRVSYTSQTKSDGLPPRTIRFICTNENVDLDGDTISTAGWNVQNYMKNPVILFAHDPSDFPYGTAKNITFDTRNKQTLVDIYFPTMEELSTDPKNVSEHAKKVDAVYCMAKAGLLNALSVGFKGKEYTPTATGRNYTSQDLMEISIVPIPANPGALAVLRSSGVADVTIKGVMEMEPTIEKSGARLSAASKDRIAKIRAKCNDLIKDMDDFEKGVDDEPNVNEEETVNGTESKPTPKAAKADNIVFTLVEKASPVQGE
jgi:hypothetical protein